MRNRMMVALIAAFSLGAGIMGTLAWVQSHSSPPVAPVASAPASGAPALDRMAAADAAARVKAAQSAAAASGAPAPGNPGGTVASDSPPANLTQGLTGPQANLALANWYYDHERWPQAIELYRATITNGIDNPNVRTDLGNALRFAGQPNEALMQYQTAQRLDPTHEQSLFNQGGLYAFAMNNPAKAVVAWKAYLKKFPQGASAPNARQFIQKFSGTKAKK